MTLHADKLEIQKQWDNNPCAAETIQDQEQGTLDYYRAIRNHRYKVYAPWFEDVMRFKEWKDKDVLEIGVGLGSDHFRFAENSNRMTALDLSREHLKQTTRHLTLEGLSTQGIYGDGENIPLDDNCFDLVYSFGVLHHTPDTEKAIKETYRVLRPGGTALIGLYHKNSYFFLSVILKNGILKGGLWRKGWRNLLSEVEYRSNPHSAMPLVKVYNKKDLRKLFSDFSQVKITSCHVDSAKLNQLFPNRRGFFERYFGWAGWYLVVRAKK